MVLGWLLLGGYFTSEEQTSSVFCRSGDPLNLSISVIACVSVCGFSLVVVVGQAASSWMCSVYDIHLIILLCYLQRLSVDNFSAVS